MVQEKRECERLFAENLKMKKRIQKVMKASGVEKFEPMVFKRKMRYRENQKLLKRRKRKGKKGSEDAKDEPEKEVENLTTPSEKSMQAKIKEHAKLEK